ncbi:MAG TPA: branched-chain amino acid ABC transporter permease [Burkholderiales bacterium]|jgi:branched-chain amino acid transport system permease protein
MRSLAAIGILTLATALLPLFISSGVVLGFITMVLYATLLGQAWNILGGFGGQFSFGHAVFFGTGAYAMAVLQLRFGLNAWVALPCAIVLGGLTGTLLGALSFRYGLRGSYFALVTLAFAEVFRILANTFDFTGAGVGLQLPLQEGTAKLQFTSEAGYLYLALSLAMISLLVAWWLKHSRYGAWLAAVRDNEDSAAALGVNAFRVKLVAITISGALMASGGAFYVQKFHYIDPHLAYGADISVQALLSAIVGGMGTIFGPLLGAVVLHGLGEITRNSLSDAPGVSLIIYGSLLVLIIMFMPRGIAGLFEGKR